MYSGFMQIFQFIVDGLKGDLIICFNVAENLSSSYFVKTM